MLTWNPRWCSHGTRAHMEPFSVHSVQCTVHSVHRWCTVCTMCTKECKWRQKRANYYNISNVNISMHTFHQYFTHVSAASGSQHGPGNRPAALTRPMGRWGGSWFGKLEHESTCGPLNTIANCPLRLTTADHPDSQRVPQSGFSFLDSDTARW